MPPDRPPGREEPPTGARTGDAGDYFQGGGTAATGRWACRARLPSVRAVRPRHRTGVMDCHVCAGVTWMASRTAANHEGYRLPAPAPRSPPGWTAATVSQPGLLAPD